MRPNVPQTLCVLSLILLGACDERVTTAFKKSGESPIVVVVELLAGTLTAPQQDFPDLEEVISREQVEAAAPRALLLRTLSTDLTTLVEPIVTNDGTETWRALSGQTLALNQGILIATRGLGDDLLASEVDGVANAVRRGRGQTVRGYQHITSNSTVLTRILTCEVSRAGSEMITIFGEETPSLRVTEQCEGAGLSISNTYNLSPRTGDILRSTQFVSDSFGYIIITPIE